MEQDWENGESGEERAGEASGVQSEVQRKVDTGVELARFCEGSSRPLNEVCCSFCWHVPSLLLFYPTPVLDRVRLNIVGLGSPFKLP